MAETGLEQGQLVTIAPRSAVDMKQLSSIISRHRGIVIAVACGVMTVAGILTVTAKPKYQSSMQILVSSNLYEGTQRSNIQGNTDKDFTDPNFQVVDYTAQQQLMLSSKLIEQAVKALKPKYQDITVEDIKGKKNRPGPLKVLRVEGGSGVNRTPSQVFEISFQDQNPEKTRHVLEALQKVYQEYNIEQQKIRLSRGLGFVNERLPEAKAKVIAAERALETFRRRHNLLDPEVQSKIHLETLAATQKQLQTTRAQLQDVQARYTNLQQKLAASPRNALVSSRLSQSNRYQTLLNEIQKTELALAQERIRYTDDSPLVQKLLEQRQNLMGLLRQEVGRSLGDKTDIDTNEALRIARSVTPSSGGERLLTQGQMAGVDLSLVEELIQVQTTALGLYANEKSLAESEKRLQEELSRYPALIAEYNRLLPEVETNRRTLEQLLQAQQSLGLKIAQGGYDWQIIEAPQRGIYIGSGRTLRLAGGLIAAPICGAIAALIWELFSDTVHSPTEMAKLTKVRLLGKVPKLKFLRPRLQKDSLLPFVGQNRGQTMVLNTPAQTMAMLPSHESLDLVYQNIQILTAPLSYKSLLITSPRPGEGKSTITLGLAMSAARMHKRVLVMDANLRHPHLHQLLELNNDWGLSLLLVDETANTYKNYLQPIHPSIDILTSGPVAEDPVQLLSSQRLRDFVEQMHSNYDLILIDAPDLFASVDARLLATITTGIILVTRMGQIQRSHLQKTSEVLENLNLVGAIANYPNTTKIKDLS